MNVSTKKLLLFSATLIINATSITQNLVIAQTETADQTGNSTAANDSSTPRFSTYKPNFAFFAFSDNDETPFQVRLSAKYTFLDCDDALNNGVSARICSPFKDKGLFNGFGDLSLYFSYTTDFDFYVFSDGNGDLLRESQPVRNRMTSPAVHFDWKRDKPDENSSFWWSNWILSLVHHSNGQDLEFETFFTDSSTTEDIRATIETLENNQPSWMDGVSRGWNYLELKSKFYIGRQIDNCDSRASCVTLYADIKIPISDVNDEIWWEPDNDSKFRDYNVIEFTVSNQWGSKYNTRMRKVSLGEKELSLQLKCGYKACSGNSWLRFDTFFGKGNFRLPFMIYGHFGRNEHFYNYHERTNTIGIGFQFNP